MSYSSPAVMTRIVSPLIGCFCPRTLLTTVFVMLFLELVIFSLVARGLLLCLEATTVKLEVLDDNFAAANLAILV